jgi:hypothetical protein
MGNHMKRILVTGTSSPFDHKAFRAAYLVGVTLAQSEFGLVTGNEAGVDPTVSRAFCSELARSGRKQTEWYCQITLPYLKRRSQFPRRRFRAEPESTIKARDFDEWIEEAITRSDAAIMIGGHSGALQIARRFIDVGKPVFPLPFTSPRAEEVFQEILKTWCASPVPGLTRNQFLLLALPWISGTGPLVNLLRGCLSDTPDIFISYRRDDAALASGRLHRDLAEHFGTRRVFMDIQHIGSSQRWKDSIQKALIACKVGVIVIGSRWLEQNSKGEIRLEEEDDVLRLEIRSLLDGHKTLIPVLVGDASLPGADALPSDIAPLRDIQARAINNATWDAAMDELIQVMESALRSRPDLREVVISTPEEGERRST